MKQLKYVHTGETPMTYCNVKVNKSIALKIMVSLLVLTWMIMQASYANIFSPANSTYQGQDHGGSSGSDGGNHTCRGDASAWVLSKWLKTQKKYIEKDISVKESNSSEYINNDALQELRNLEKKLNEAHTFFQLHKQDLIDRFQSGGYDALEKVTEASFPNLPKLQKKYSIPLMIDLENLQKLLKEIILYDHQLVLISSHNHVTALFRDKATEDKTAYYYFDPAGEKYFDQCAGCIKEAGKESIWPSTDDIANSIFISNSFNISIPSPLIIEIFSFDGQAGYPNLEENVRKFNNYSYIRPDYAQGRTSIHKAAQYNSLEPLKYLTSLNKWLINQSDQNGFTPLMLAVSNDSIDTALFLLEEWTPQYQYNDIMNALMLAKHYNRCNMIKLLLEYDFYRRWSESLAIYGCHITFGEFYSHYIKPHLSL